VDAVEIRVGDGLYELERALPALLQQRLDPS